MLGDFIIKILVLLLGYVYPALECFKAIEQRQPDMRDLLFWCQYWVIIAILTAIERFGDIFISWLPLYGESKLAFIVYLWHPKTRGTTDIYNRFLRPFMAEHESDIETRLHMLLNKSIDLLVFYFKNFTEQGQSYAFKLLSYVLNKPNAAGSRPPPPPPQQNGRHHHQSPPPPPLDRRNGRGRNSPPRSPRPAPPPPPPYAPSAPPYLPPVVAGARVDPADVEEEDMLNRVNHVEEALRAAGVNLRRLRQPR